MGSETNRKDDLKLKKALIAILMTIAVVTGLVLSGPEIARALQINMDDPGTVTKKENAKFNITITLENQDQSVPIDNVKVIVGDNSATFNLDNFDNGTRIAGYEHIYIENVVWGENIVYENDKGYASNPDTGDNYFGYGWGYTNENSETGDIILTVKVDTSGFTTESQNVQSSIYADGSIWKSQTKTLKIQMRENVGIEDGWNMVSLPIKSENQRAENIFPNKTIYSWTGTQYKLLEGTDNLEPVQGYWVLADTPENVEIQGYTADNIIELQEGWNLLGLPTTIEKTVENVFQDRTTYGWTGTQYKLLEGTDNLEPAESYWVLSDNEENISLN